MIRKWQHSFIVPLDDNPATFTILSGLSKLFDSALLSVGPILWETLSITFESDNGMRVCRIALKAIDDE